MMNSESGILLVFISLCNLKVQFLIKKEIVKLLLFAELSAHYCIKKGENPPEPIVRPSATSQPTPSE
jgi:hypothetical protein